MENHKMVIMAGRRMCKYQFSDKVWKVTKCLFYHFDFTQVSLRRQEIADRLNAWTIFNDKNKEFCDWLTQMENKVCHSGDLSIEEMVEKLKKVLNLPIQTHGRTGVFIRFHETDSKTDTHKGSIW